MDKLIKTIQDIQKQILKKDKHHSKTLLKEVALILEVNEVKDLVTMKDNA